MVIIFKVINDLITIGVFLLLFFFVCFFFWGVCVGGGVVIVFICLFCFVFCFY